MSFFVCNKKRKMQPSRTLRLELYCTNKSYARVQCLVRQWFCAEIILPYPSTFCKVHCPRALCKIQIWIYSLSTVSAKIAESFNSYNGLRYLLLLYITADILLCITIVNELEYILFLAVAILYCFYCCFYNFVIMFIELLEHFDFC